MDVTPKTILVIAVVALITILAVKWLGDRIPALSAIAGRI